MKDEYYVNTCASCNFQHISNKKDLVYCCFGFYTTPPCTVCKRVGVIDGYDLVTRGEL